MTANANVVPDSSDLGTSAPSKAEKNCKVMAVYSRERAIHDDAYQQID